MFFAAMAGLIRFIAHLPRRAPCSDRRRIGTGSGVGGEGSVIELRRLQALKESLVHAVTAIDAMSTGPAGCQNLP
jgi:hypothetical protein